MWSNDLNYICFSILLICHCDVILIFLFKGCISPCNCLFIPPQYTKRTIWHLPQSKIFSYVENPNIFAHAMHLQLHFHKKCERFMRNTYSNFKYHPVVTEYISLPHFVAIKHHCTKHTSHISRTFPTEPLTMLHSPSNTKHFHCSQMCSFECWQIRFHLYLYLFHFFL